MMFGGVNEAEKSEGRRIVLQCIKALRGSPHKLKDSHPWIVKFKKELKRDKMLRKRKKNSKKILEKDGGGSSSSSDSSDSSSSSSSSSEDEDEKNVGEEDEY